MARKHHATIDTPHGPRRCYQVTHERPGRKPLVARLGGIPLTRRKNAVLVDRDPTPGGHPRRKELITRLLAGRCELCEQPATVHVHHVRKLADLTTLGRPRPGWMQIMAKKRRKTLVVCQPCHDLIHQRQPNATPTE